MSENAIEVNGLKKSFLLPHQKNKSIKNRFTNPFAKYDNEKQVAFKNISFEVKKGEFFGIVGRNGSGKSTLLKCLAGVYSPDSGSINVDGKLVPFIELGVGFNPELSGRDNVYLNGALLGFNRKDITAMYDEIVDFAELERFMDQKLKNYSSGMQVRLAFSIAIKAQGDILLLDEVLAVGDSAFQQKCYDYFAELKKSNKTIVLVSHNMQAVQRFCDRALLLDNGIIKKIGTSEKIGNMYEEMFLREEANRLDKQLPSQMNLDEENPINLEARVEQDGKTKIELNQKDEIDIYINVESKKMIPRADIGINIKDRDKNMILSVGSASMIGPIELKPEKKQTIIFKVENIFKRGLYTVNLGVADMENIEAPRVIIRSESAANFVVAGDTTKAITMPKVNVSSRI